LEQQKVLQSVDECSFVPMECVGDDGELDLSQTRQVEDVRSGYTLFFDNDVIVAKITPCFENGKGAVAKGLTNGLAFGTTELFVLGPSESLLSEYLYYLTYSEPFRKQGEAQMSGAAGQKRITDEFVRNFRFALPPLETQRQIASYLDRETGEIDRLIAAKERLLTLLAEKRRALIGLAVTQGTSLDADLIDSGIEWIGKIPKHWQVVRGKQILTERDERSENGEEELLTVSHITGVTSRSEKDVTMFEAVSKEGYKICRRGDLAVNTMWAFMGAMGTSALDGIVSPSYNVYIPSTGIDPEYLDILVRIPNFCEDVRRNSKEVWSSRLRLYAEALFDIRFPVPPLEEQVRIVATLRRDLTNATMMEEWCRKSISLIGERRSALIAAAVTGQLEVEGSVE